MDIQGNTSMGCNNTRDNQEINGEEIEYEEEGVRYPNNYYQDVILIGKTKMLLWVDDLGRSMKMATALFEFQQMVKPILTVEIRDFIAQHRSEAHLALDAIHSRLKRRIERKRYAFIILFSLCDFLQSRQSILLLDKGVQFRLNNILVDLMHSNAFKNSDFIAFMEFLRIKFDIRGTCNMTTLYRKWQSSRYSNGMLTVDKINCNHYDPDVLDVVFFGSLRSIMLLTLKHNVVFLPTYTELGNYNLKIWSDFLHRFQINSSGPYKKELRSGEMKLQFFISSSSALDCLYNSNQPFYGVFEFPFDPEMKFPMSIEHREVRFNYVNQLPLMPLWLQEIPPQFAKTFHFMDTNFELLSLN